MIKSHTFRGKRYKISFQNNLKDKALGLCDSPAGKNKTIKIKKNMSDFNELETIIHESLHACFWDIDEEAIHESSGDIARILWRLNFRRRK